MTFIMRNIPKPTVCHHNRAAMSPSSKDQIMWIPTEIFDRLEWTQFPCNNSAAALLESRGVVRGVVLKPTSPQALKTLSPQALKPQTLKPTSPQTLKLINLQALKLLNPKVLQMSPNVSKMSPKCLDLDIFPL